jgi:hypothetical protein
MFQIELTGLITPDDPKEEQLTSIKRLEMLLQDYKSFSRLDFIGRYNLEEAFLIILLNHSQSVF